MDPLLSISPMWCIFLIPLIVDKKYNYKVINLRHVLKVTFKLESRKLIAIIKTTEHKKWLRQGYESMPLQTNLYQYVWDMSQEDFAYCTQLLSSHYSNISRSYKDLLYNYWKADNKSSALAFVLENSPYIDWATIPRIIGSYTFLLPPLINNLVNE